MSNAGIYIHIPFCARKCPYCDFYSVGYRRELAAQYTDALCAQLRTLPRATVDSIYFGGGTPSLLDPAQVARILDGAAAACTVTPDCEITLEMNPATCTPASLDALRAAGVNRLSIGVQSTDDATLRRIGRLHNRDAALETVRLAAAHGFENLSADVMLALPGEDADTLRATLLDLCALPLTHLSAYLLKLMPGTPFGAHPPAGLPDDDAQAGLYEFACALLERHGFAQYEISNFARGAGYESRHNLKYWRCEPYFGLGAAAHSSVDGRLYSFPRDISAYLAQFPAAQGAQATPAEFCAPLTPEAELAGADFAMLSLRTTAGLDLAQARSRFGFSFGPQAQQKLTRFARAGLCRQEGGVLRLTRRGMLVSNAILCEIL